MDLVVVFEPFRQLGKNLLSGLKAIDMHIVPLEGIYEPLGHSVALRALDRRCARQQSHAGCEHPRFMRRVSRAVVAEPLSRRYEKGAMILTSNQPFSGWGEVFGDTIIATAILDRVLHHSITINIKGESYRLKEKLKAGIVQRQEPKD